jgi:hypothetical protein
MDILLQEFLPERIRRTKERLKTAQEKSPAKMDWLAHCMGVTASRLYQQLDPNKPGDRFYLDNLEIFISETGDFGPLDDIEARLGRVAFKQPGSLESVQEINLQVAQVFAECAEVCRTVTILAAPGEPQIPWEEFKRIKRRVRQTQRELAALESAARQQAAKHPSWPRRLWDRLKFYRAPKGGKVQDD